MATSFSDGRSWSTQREPPTMGKQLVNFITCGCESSAPFFCNLQSRARTHAVLVKGLYELLDLCNSFLYTYNKVASSKIRKIRYDIFDGHMNMLSDSACTSPFNRYPYPNYLDNIASVYIISFRIGSTSLKVFNSIISCCHFKGGHYANHTVRKWWLCRLFTPCHTDVFCINYQAHPRI